MSDYLHHLESELAQLAGAEVSRPCYAFGMHKGGSTMLDDFLNVYSKVGRFRSISLSNLLFKQGVSDEAYTRDAALLPLLDRKVLYRGFRYVPAFVLGHKSRLVNRPAIALVRDPRDCVVSAYFSFLKSHVVSANAESDAASKIHAEREAHRQSTVDDYAEQEIHRFVEEIMGIMAFAHPNLAIFRYEDIIFEKRRFFRQVIDHLGLPFDDKAFERALTRVDVVPDAERPDQHIRSVAPGNYKKKLSPATIGRVSASAEIVLEAFGYER